MIAPNVLLVVMDSVRARNTSLHDHRHDTTPFLSRLTSMATKYSNARAPSQWSLPSHASLFTGLHVPEHGITADGDALEEDATLFDDLSGRGYRTGLFSANPYLTSLDTGLDSGFDQVEGAVQDPMFDGVDPDAYKGEPRAFLRAAVRSGRPVRSLANGFVSKLVWDHPHLVSDRLVRKVGSGTTPGSTFTDLFLDWLDDGSGPWAACINYMDAHHPYDPKPAFDEWDDGSIAAVQSSLSSLPMGVYTGADPWWKLEVLEHLYDGTIRQVDREVERLVNALRDREEFEETLLVVTSDHGEGFGERSRVRDIRLAGHNIGENEVNLHVPLVVNYPRQETAATVDRPVSLSAIRNVVDRTVEGERGTDLFEEHLTLARTQGLRTTQLAELAEVSLDTTAFEGETDVLYEFDGSMITKQVVWNGTSASVRCVDARTAYTLPDAEGEALLRTFASLEDAGVARNADDENINDNTKRRLDELGYR